MSHRDKRTVLLVGLIALLVWGADQATKAWVRASIPLYGAVYPLPFASDFFRLTHLTNTGVAFGFLQDSSLLYLLIAGVIVVAIVLYARHLPWEHPLVRVAAGLQLGGALGNLTDRLRLGHVTDFLDFYVRIGNRTYHYPPFNLADTSIVVGVAVLMWVLWQTDVAQHGRRRSPDHPGDASI